MFYNLWWMEPKFQSSFIPRSSVSSSAPNTPLARPPRERDFFSFVAFAIFTLSIILAVGVFGYKFFLNYRIGAMGEELEEARSALAPETVTELIRLNARLASTGGLVRNHRIISPVFDFLELSTPESIRYTDFSYSSSNKGLELTLRGEARGYASLAAAAEVVNQSNYFQNASFSELRLDERGNVVFSMKATLEPALLSYERFVETAGVLPQTPVSPVATTTSATTTPQ